MSTTGTIGDTRRRNRVSVVVLAAVVATLVAAVVLVQRQAPEPADAAETSSIAVREDSHVLGARGTGAATLVEFLDFECEACRAAYPVVEDLRDRHAGELTFVVRYFPNPGHANARNAAHAVEAAARQGHLEPMYTLMFQTQPEWGEQQDSKAHVFRGFAQQLGLNMARYDRDVASDSVARRVERDFQDGRQLGVPGTPTFFLDGRRLELTNVEEFVETVDAAARD